MVTLGPTEKVGTVVDILKSNSHNGFPVVDRSDDPTDTRTYGKVRGLILRSELIVLLQHKIFNETYGQWEGKLTAALFRAAYPRYPDISRIYASSVEREYTLDLRPVMNPSPSTMLHSTSLPQVFRRFRALGLVGA